jgi:hypothetical protein
MWAGSYVEPWRFANVRDWAGDRQRARMMRNRDHPVHAGWPELAEIVSSVNVLQKFYCDVLRQPIPDSRNEKGALMLRRIGCSLFAALTTILFTTTDLAAEEHWLQNYFDANGGCGQHRLAFNRLGNIAIDVRRNLPRGANPEVFGKPASNWTDEDIKDAMSIYFKCEAQIDAAQKNRCMASGYDEKHCDRGPSTVTMTLAKGVERDLRQIVHGVRERVDVQQRQETAQQTQEASRAMRQQRMAEDEARRRQQELADWIARDRAAAAEAARRAEIEEPRIAEALKEADEARRAREAAEQKLANIRSQLRVQEKARQDELSRTEAAETSRQRETQRETPFAKPLAAVTAPANAGPSQTVNSMPDVEMQFIAAIENARSVYKSGANDMAKGAARPLRAKELCALLRSSTASNWVGKISTLSTNGDGKGVLAIEIGKDIVIKTWNNAVSDAGDRTLIDPASPLFSRASSLSEGKQVVFSGTFRPSSTDCVKEGSLTMSGSLMKPEFIFRFSDVSPK